MSIVRKMNRVFGLALLGLTPLAAIAAAPSAPSPRVSTDLSSNWRFKYGEEPTTVTSAAFDDSAWQAISVPHTWNHIGEYAEKRSAEANDNQGVGWYRLHVKAPAAGPHKRQYLQFDGVGIIADVWVNGVAVGTHKGAFSRFRFDVTSTWKPGADNLIVVKADNSKPAIGSSTQDVLPLSGDFFIHGGIYRGVSLITANDVGIDLMDYAGPGVYVRAEGSSERAKIEITARFRSFKPKPGGNVAIVTVRDSSGTALKLDIPMHIVIDPPKEFLYDCPHGNCSVDPDYTGHGTLTVDMPKPHLWNGLTAPYLYTATVKIFDGKRLLDSVTVPFGIRSYKFDPNTGLSLNGKPLPLHGVSRHQDKAGKGYALSPADHAEDMALIKELGANTIRGAHYEHAQEWYDLADKNGMVMWAELPFVTTPSLNGGEGSPALFANAEQQMRELIRQNYNHPSIFMWSIGNEVDAARGFGIGSEPAKPLKLLQHMQEIAKAEDPSRPTTFADCCEDLGMMATAGEKLAGNADLIGYNRYYGWYYGKAAQSKDLLGAQLDKFHAKHPMLPMSVSEYGAGGAITQHCDNVFDGQVNMVGRPQPEEYQAYVLEQNWAALKTRKFVFASWVWNMFDFASDLREEGDSVDLNTKGLVTYDRKVKKDAFYFFQANWTSAAMVHLNGRRYLDRAYLVNDVKGYTTADSASLNLNGVNAGAVPCPDHICVWPNVALKPGPNTLMASATLNGVTARDTIILNGPDLAKGIHIDVGNAAGHVNALGERYGSDTFATGGVLKMLNAPAFGAHRSHIKKEVTGATDPALYDYWREGAFSYDVPLANGIYAVTIHSFEPVEALAATRTFNVTANGTPGLSHFSPSHEAGGTLKAATGSFTVKVTDGHLKLDFGPDGGPAVLAAIAIEPKGR